jgi:diguanylate cyclase (GGDEF)-like protein/PAS domain S-box-containing protein
MELMILEDLYYRIVESAVVAIGVTDRKGNFVVVNKAWCQFMGYTEQEAKQLNIKDITPSTDIEESDNNYDRLIAQEIECFCKIKQYKRKDGSLFWADLNVSVIMNDKKESIGVLGIFINIDDKVKADKTLKDMNDTLEGLNEDLVKANIEITKTNRELEKAYEELDKLARRDALTDLFNRRSMDEILKMEMDRSRRTKRPFFVAIADIDNFKSFNDTYGHECGDDVLKIAAKVFLEKGIRSTDYVGRWGGEEFLFVITETDFDGAMIVLERVREEMSKVPLRFHGQDLHITITIGFSYRKGHYKIDELVAEADKALYQGKRNGKNQVVCFYCSSNRGSEGESV